MLALLLPVLSLVASGAERPHEPAYQAVLDRYLAGGAVDYAALHAAKAMDPIVASLAVATVPEDPKAATAFWINGYNALTLDLVADSWPIASIRELDGGKVWDARTFVVAGKATTLNQIENDRLRPLGDPRIHAALNCASRGCPPLTATAFEGSKLDLQLDAQARTWMHTTGFRIDRQARTVALSNVFAWFRDDFRGTVGPDVPGLEGDDEAAIRFAIRYADEPDAAWLRAGGYTVTTLPYDWAVNGR
jgi:hypothetical protein